MSYLRIKILTLANVTLFMTFTSCHDNFVKQEIPIDKIDTSGVYVTYEYKNQKYEKIFELDVSSEHFYDSDSMTILINKENPEEVKFESIIHREWPKEDVLIELK